MGASGPQRRRAAPPVSKADVQLDLRALYREAGDGQTLPVLMDGRKVNDARLQELLATLGLRGRAVGAALQACLDAVMDETLPNDRAALLGYAAENLQRFANS